MEPAINGPMEDSMQRFGWLVLGALLVGACTDDKNPAARPDHPLAPAAAAVPEVTAASSVCRAYQRDLLVVKQRLEQAPSDTELLASADALGAIITDACN